MAGGNRRKLAIHGPIVELDCAMASLETCLDTLFGEFTVAALPPGFVPASGMIQPYQADEVARRLSPSARHLTRSSDGMDVYGQGDRFWMVDDRWGISEVNFLRNQFRSWVIEQPRVDPVRVTELAVVLPLAQLLGRQGLHLLPAISAVCDGFAVLILCPFGLEPEMLAMIHGGYKLIGQRWTALREEDGRLALLHLPGGVERFSTPRLRFSTEEDDRWIDLTAEHPGSWQNHAFCDAVLIVESQRQSSASLGRLSPVDAREILTSQWPILRLDPGQESNPVIAGLTENCPVFQTCLSRNSRELLSLLRSIRYANPMPDSEAVAA